MLNGDWYIGPAMQNYCCCLLFILEKHGVRISNMAKNIPTQTQVPTDSYVDDMIVAIH